VEYTLKIAQRQISADVEINDDRSLKIVLDQNPYDVQYQMISDNRIHMEVRHGNRMKLINAYVTVCPEGKNIFINGRQYLVYVLEGKRNKIKKGAVPELPDQITPPTPAVVVKIFVQVGESVKKGQGVIAVSAMKMETTLCAPFDGIVTDINCAINDKVSPGQVLVEIKKEGDL